MTQPQIDQQQAQQMTLQGMMARGFARWLQAFPPEAWFATMMNLANDPNHTWMIGGGEMGLIPGPALNPLIDALKKLREEGLSTKPVKVYQELQKPLDFGDYENLEVMSRSAALLLLRIAQVSRESEVEARSTSQAPATQANGKAEPKAEQDPIPADQDEENK